MFLVRWAGNLTDSPLASKIKDKSLSKPHGRVLATNYLVRQVPCLKNNCGRATH